MGWTYTASPYPIPWPYVVGLPAPQPCIDTVRFLLGDTIETDPQLQDGEVAGLLAQNAGSPYQAAIEGCRALASYFARQADKSVGDLHILASQRSRAYLLLIKDLEAQAMRHDAPTPYMGGISVADKQIDQDDDDVVGPAFVKDMMDDRGTAPNFGDFVDGGSFQRAIPGG